MHDAHTPGDLATGDEMVVVINKARPIPISVSSPSSSQAASTSNIQKVRRGDVRRAVLVRTRYPLRRPDGRYVRSVWQRNRFSQRLICGRHYRFDDNACVLLNNKGEMIGTRVNGVVAAELRNVQGGAAGAGGRWSKILGLAGKVGLCATVDMLRRSDL